MGCCSSDSGQGNKTDPPIIDVQKTVADHTWSSFCNSRSRWKNLFTRRKNYTIEVPMNYFHFQVLGKPEFPEPNSKSDGNQGDKDQKGEDTGGPVGSSSHGSQQHVGLETVFKNSTGERQTYNFRCEKTRKATMTVTYQKGFSIGGKANFSLGLPKVLADGKLSSEIYMVVSVSKTTGETFEQTLTTCATSDITIAPHSHYTATVVMEERHLVRDFKTRVLMTMPLGSAYACIKNKEGRVVHSYGFKNLSDMFPSYTHTERSDALKFVIEGRVDGVQMSTHTIHLVDRGHLSQEAEKLNDSEKVEDSEK